MVGDSSRVDVGRTVADEGDSGEGEEQAEVEDIVRAWNRMGLGEPSGVRNQATFVRDDGCVGGRSVGHAISRRGTFSPTGHTKYGQTIKPGLRPRRTTNASNPTQDLSEGLLPFSYCPSTNDKIVDLFNVS